MATKHIALIDDSSPFCLLVKQIFEDQYEVDRYSSAVDFLSVISRITHYDLILLDINLPQMDGLEALTKLKSLSKTRSIPILLLTGDTRKDTVVRGIKLGAQGYIAKPIDPLLLEERVTQLLEDPSSQAPAAVCNESPE
ncbi:response regulator [Paenibacillus radicis (ex Xue et al. 2023)]|uniref:Response regulator n=1 Tax=Paenibacillus radicis (ex Xue et al. 2023) TaxID=2972489 RepID=A0ABT1YV85_9BACL|nr:response regulator [Paenibacillus radicis (ex Xue et al. 2023)]MCR8636853.1 response regulator [Paenibacillus radicis (ex Xue et al. 2023)]